MNKTVKLSEIKRQINKTQQLEQTKKWFNHSKHPTVTHRSCLVLLLICLWMDSTIDTELAINWNELLYIYILLKGNRVYADDLSLFIKAWLLLRRATERLHRKAKLLNIEQRFISPTGNRVAFCREHFNLRASWQR